MSKMKNAWEAGSWEELATLTSLDAVTKALTAAENSRTAHKKAYLRKALILERAKEAGITAD